jgi:hypothetical protein
MTPEPRGLVMYVIYKHPLDYPKEYVCRRWVGETPDAEPYARGKLSEVRRALPPGLYRMPRWKNDDPAILEVWF